MKLDTYDSIHLNSLRARYLPHQEAMTGPVSSWRNRRFSGLEIGVGTGNTAQLFLSQFPRLKLLCIDVDTKAIQLSQLKLRPWLDRVGLVLGDFMDMEIEGRFDLVFSALTLHNYEPRKQLDFLKKSRSHLSNTGLYVGCEFMLHESEKENRAQWNADHALLRREFKGEDLDFWTRHHKEVHEKTLRPISWYKRQIAGAGFRDMLVLKRSNFYCTFSLTPTPVR